MPKIKFHQSGKFSTKIGKFSTSAECSNSCNSAKKIFFLVHIFVSGKFSTKVEKIPISLLGMKFGKREGLDAENKISPKWKIFHQKVENFRPLQNVPIHAILQKNFFFFASFWKWKIFHQSGKNSNFIHWGWNLANAKV